MDCHYRIVIIGGGVAGLSAANRLLDLGIQPLLIEAGSYPQQRICGEFLSYECLPILDNWGISIPYEVNVCTFNKNNSSFSFNLTNPCGSLSRDILEEKLASRAIQKGAILLQNTKVKSWKEGVITLENEEIITTDKIILGTGKFENQHQPLVYYGYKTHLRSHHVEDRIDMHCFDNGYLGFNRVGEYITNVAILSKKPLNPSDIVSDDPIFPWISGRVPEFGIKHIPVAPNIFRVGDAIGTIPPASGDGLAMAITSGCMVAEYSLNSSTEIYEKAWKVRYANRITWAKRLHFYLLHSPLAAPVMKICSYFPWIPQTLFKLTRE